MTREAAAEQVRGYLESYLQGKGISTRKNFRCLNPQHTDKNPSMSYDARRNKCHCFACGADYDIFNLIEIDYGLSGRDIFDKAYEMYHIEIDSPIQDHKKEPTPKITDFTPYFLKAHENVGETNYFRDRGLSAATIDRFHLGYDMDFRTGSTKWPAAIIPTGKQSYVARNVSPTCEKSQRYRKIGNSNLFHVEALHGEKPVFVVEGELDAMSIIEIGQETMALGSTANYHKFVQYLMTNSEKIHVPYIFVCLDNDDDGRKTTDKIRKELAEYTIVPIKFVNLYGRYKDANEFLVHDRIGFTAAIENTYQSIEREKLAAADDYQKTSAAGHIPTFWENIMASTNAPYIPTGFPELDSELDGGLYAGLYIIGAISSLGKTTYLIQMADQIAEHGHDVLFFSLEMPREQIMAKSISRLTFQHCVDNERLAKTVRGIMVGKRYENYTDAEKSHIQACMDRYKTFGSRVYIHEGMGDIGVERIKEIVDNHIKITGNIPVVMIDYIQILAPYDMRATDKQNIDKSVLELKRLSRDRNLTIIGVSSLNRQNYNTPITMEAFKESGAIEYSSDVLLGMQLHGVGGKDFDTNAEKKKNPRAVELIVLKNRNGRTGGKIQYEYYAIFNCFMAGTANGFDMTVGRPDADGFQPIHAGNTPFDI